MEELSSTILVHRRARFLRNRALTYRIEVDGQLGGGVRSGKTLRLAVAPGPRAVEASIALAGSQVYEFEAIAGQEHRFALDVNPSARAFFTQAFGDDYLRLTPTSPNSAGTWRKPSGVRRPSRGTLGRGGVTYGLLGAILGGLFGADARQRLFGLGLGVITALVWLALVRSGRIRPRSGRKPALPIPVRLGLIAIASLLASIFLAPSIRSPCYGVGIYCSYLPAAIIVVLAVELVYRRLATRTRQ